MVVAWTSSRSPWLLAAFLFVVSAACTSAGPSAIRYDDDGESNRWPIATVGGYSAGVWTQRLGDPYTASIVLAATHRATIRVERLRPVARSHNLEILGILAAGPERHMGSAMGGEGFPPIHLPPSMRTRYRSLDLYRVKPREGDGMYGVDVIIGLRFQTGQRAWFDGLEVTYTVDGQRYIGRFRVAWAMCRYTPCEAPGIGKPFDGEP